VCCNRRDQKPKVFCFSRNSCTKAESAGNTAGNMLPSGGTVNIIVHFPDGGWVVLLGRGGSYLFRLRVSLFWKVASLAFAIMGASALAADDYGQPSLKQSSDEVVVIDDGGFSSLCEAQIEFLRKSGYWVGPSVVTKTPNQSLVFRTDIFKHGNKPDKVVCWRGAGEVINVVIDFENEVFLK